MVRTGSAVGHGCRLHDRPRLKVRESQGEQCLFMWKGGQGGGVDTNQVRPGGYGVRNDALTGEIQFNLVFVSPFATTLSNEL